MSLVETRGAQLYPTLNSTQIASARRFASGAQRALAAHETLFATGEREAPAYLVLQGSVEVLRHDVAGAESLITSHGPGQLTGEISQLAGRAALVEGRAGPDGCTVLPFDAAHLRAMIIGSAELGELIMRAFILRRSALITDGGAGSVLLGRSGDPGLTRIEGFLARNGYPYTMLGDLDADGKALIDRLGLHDDDLPVVLCPNGEVLKRPSEAQVGVCLGITPDIDPEKLYDVAVVGAGPAGLATAVYAASEGLSVAVLDARAFGGQAGASARIENYLGFPTGITGQSLAARAFTQAQKFGADIIIPVRVETLVCGGDTRKPGDPFLLRLEGDRELRARTVVIASGAKYRQPGIDQLDRFEGAGVSYWASPVEARLCAGEDVALVGAGNSAGQAVAFLAPRVRSLKLIVRGEGLQASMSRYLIDRIESLSNVELHTQTEVVSLDADERGELSEVGFRHRLTGETWRAAIRHLFLFIGADPNTDWLAGCTVEVDDKGFVKTGGDWNGAPWAASGRRAHALETRVPGVFAIGDVRGGSTKRVAAAVGEGAQVVAAIHGVLAQG